MLTETPGSRFRHLQPLGALERAFFIYTTSSFGKTNQSGIDELDRQLASWIDKKSYRSLPSRWQWLKLFTSAYERLLNDQLDCTSFASARPLYQRLMHLVKEYETALRTSSGATGISRSIRTCRCPTHGYRSLGKRKPPCAPSLLPIPLRQPSWPSEGKISERAQAPLWRPCACSRSRK